jgi:hypothetical protein
MAALAGTPAKSHKKSGVVAQASPAKEAKHSKKKVKGVHKASEQKATQTKK